MGQDNQKKPESISIVCPCGHNFKTLYDGEVGEFPCPSCGRINVYSEGRAEGASDFEKKGKTTVQTLPLTPRIEPGDFIGPYCVLEFIGEGGMGRVYAAEDPRLQRKVAVKVLSQKLLSKSDFVARFQREARAIARLNDPHIVQIYFTGVHEELPYYAMEMVSGGSLEDSTGGEMMASEQAVTMMLQAARGLELASREGIIHRDIKPSNLMLDSLGRLKITDFGLAKTIEIESAITHTGTIIGTPYYMSPEQGEGNALDRRADIYSLGATFYHLLSGNPPFEAESPIAVILKHINEKLPALSTRNRQVPKGLSQIIDTMMAKNPDERYTDYTNLIRDLKAFQAGKKEGFRRKVKKPKPSGSKTAGSAPAGREARSSFIVLDREILESSEEIELRRCGMFRRFLALCTDVVILCLLFTLYFRSAAPQSSAAVSAWCSLFLVISFLYFFLGDARGGMTLGKILFHCRVGLKDGENIGFGKSCIRTLLFFPILFAPGAITERTDLVEFITTFFKAGAGIFGVHPAEHVIGELSTAAYLFAQICALWLIISVGFFIVTPGRTLLHDLVTRSFFFSFVRRKSKQKAVPQPVKGGAPGAGTAAAESSRAQESLKPQDPSKPPESRGHQEPWETGTRRKRPPPLPSDALAPRRRTPAPAMPSPLAPIRTKSPRLAFFLSIFPGLGQLYNGDYMKGLIVFLSFWLIIPWMFGFIDAYLRARSINRRADFNTYTT